SRRRPVARDLRGTVFGFQVVIGSWPKFYLNLALGASYAYMPFSSPTPICRFRALRLYAVFQSYAYMSFSRLMSVCRFRVLRLYDLDLAETTKLRDPQMTRPHSP